MEIPAADLAGIRELYVQGRYRKALEAAAPFGPLRGWTNTPARILAGRLAMQLGAPRLGRKLHAAAYRHSPAYPDAVYYHARYRFERFGPLSCWQFMRAHPDWSEASPDLRADWLALSGFVAARFRDFDRADRFLNQAEATAPNRAWVAVERASVLEAAEKPAAALASAHRALGLHPWFRPAVQAVAHLLQRQGREKEAVAFLTEATGHLESGIVAAQLAGLQLDLGRHADARASLDRYAELSPLMEPEAKKWLTARRADVAYLLGDSGSAEREARQVGEEFYTNFADALASRPCERAGEGQNPPVRTGGSPGRVILPVDLTYTGPPPTVYDLLSRYHGHPFPNPPADAGAPLDGLPDAAERRRAESAGWQCSEFTLTADGAAELIESKTPFLVTLVEVGVSQPRLVVGYDRARNSLFLADGPDRKPAEAPLDVLLKRYASTGPRCLVAVPKPDPEFGEVLTNDSPAFPDVPRYSALFRIQSLLADLKFAEAKDAIAAMRQKHPGHRLTKMTAVAWARATAHPVLLLDAMDDLLADFPGDPTFALTKAAALRELGRTGERLAVLREVGAKPDADPLLMQSLAQMLLADPREQADADRLLRRSVRVRPGAAAGYYLLASQRWEQRHFAEAAELYRAAACLDDREDQFADAYARVAKATGQGPEALRLFQQKATRADRPHPPAVRALFNALLDRDEPDQAFAMLSKAIEKLSAAGSGEVEPMSVSPSPLAGEGLGVRGSASRVAGADPSPPAPLPQGERGEKAALADLRLFRAEALAQFGKFDAAEAELAAARAVAPPAAWHKTAAKVTRMKPDLSAAAEQLTEALTHDPLWPEGNRLLAGLTAETAGRAAAREFVGRLARRFPYSYPVARLRAEFLTPDLDDESVRAIEDLLALCPHDAWALRQLALVRADRKEDAGATAAAAAAGKIEPDHPSYFAVLAHAHRRADRTADALEACRAGLRFNVDHDLLVTELVHLSRGRSEKRASLRFVADQLRRQPHAGDGLVAFRDQALALAAEDDEEQAELFDELLADLEKALDDRPDLWQAWSLMIQQLGLTQRLEEARELARDATERFPLLAQLWSDLARVHGALGQSEERLEALRAAAAAAPGWPPAARELADALAEAGEPGEAVAVLERAAARAPLDPTAHAALADALWEADRSEEALDRAKQAVRHEPGFDAAWGMVAHWSDRLDRPDEVLDLARELTRDRPGDPRGWLKLARLLNEPGDADEALAALDTAIRLDPRNVDAYDLKAERLADVGRFDEALAAARPPDLAEDLPLTLQGRAAWVEAKRGNYAAAIPPMQALVSVEPNYYWGWHQLAEWYNETGRHAGYLEAAAELCRLKPEHPVPLTMRGEAKLKTNDRDGGKADLRDALRLAAEYAPAAAILFDACLADGEHRDARSALAVLQEHAGGPEVLVKQTQFAARTGDAEAALRALSELAETPGDGPPIFLQLAFAEIDAAKWGDRAAKVLRESWQGGGPFCPWAPLYWLDTPDGQEADPDDRLAAVDAVNKAYPKFAAAYDKKAELLAQAGRYDDAAAACRPAALGDPPPITLRGRAAWVEAKRGSRSKAIALMKQAVADDPGYLWGWRNLAQWYDAEGRFKECLAAAETMVRLAPDDPLAYGYRGEAKRTLGDKAGARADFQKAFDLDPAFDAAGLHLIAEQLEADEVEEAARTLNTLREHASGPLVKLRALQVAAKQGDLAATRQRFKVLLADATATRGVVREAATSLEREGWAGEADAELAAAVAGPDATPAAAGVWADRLIAADKEFEVLDRLPDLLTRNGPAGREAVLAYAAAAAVGGRPAAAGSTVHRFADQLRADTDTWARAGAALAAGQSYALAASWLSDWRDRDGVGAWMLRPLADALRALDRDDEAIEVCRAAVRLAGPPEVLAEFRGWLALDAALDGRTAEAAGLLRAIDQVGLGDGVKLVLGLAEAVVMVQQAGPDGKRGAFAEARAHLRAAADACDPADVPAGAGRWYKRAVARLASDAGGLPAKLWAAWQQMVPAVREGRG